MKKGSGVIFRRSLRVTNYLQGRRKNDSRPAFSRPAQDLFEIVDRGGSYQGLAGVGGGITGMGFDLGIIDDPFKNFDQAHSQKTRDKIDEWYTTTFWTRQSPNARILLTMTRWHHDDLAGRLLERMKNDPAADQWVVLRLPAVADGDLHPDDPRVGELGEPGEPCELLWPERFGQAFMDSARAQGAYFFAGMYQQSPTPEGGNHFQEQWFEHRFDDGGKHWHLRDRRFNKSDCAVFVTCDPAASERNSADHTAIGVWTVTPENDLLLLDVVRGRFGVDRIVPELLAVSRRWNPGWIALEANGFQVAIVQAARGVAGMAPIRQISHEGKETGPCALRPSSWPSRASSGCPRSAKWIKAYVDRTRPLHRPRRPRTATRST